MHHTNKKDDQTSKQEWTKIRLNFLPKRSVGFYFIVSEVRVWQMWETVYGEDWSYYYPKMEMDVYVDTEHIRCRPLYVIPMASTFLDRDTMDEWIKKAVDWYEGLPSCDATYVMKMELSATIGVTLKYRSVVLDQWYDVGCWGDGWDKQRLCVVENTVKLCK